MSAAVDTNMHEPESRWYVLRDLKRSNARTPAYKALAELGFKVFTPLKTQVIQQGGRQIRREVPFIQDLLFVYADKDALDKIIIRTDTLQYRYLKGQAYCTPMVVPASDMERFMAAVSSVKTPRYYSVDEITPAMYGARIRMTGTGALSGIEGRLLKTKGSRKKRLLIELPGILAAAVEITADYIEII